MKDIMAQTISGQKSSITQGLAAAKRSEDSMDVPAPFRLPGPKMSQKDRKRMQQVQQASVRASPVPEEQ
jgi:hypothetical protein